MRSLLRFVFLFLLPAAAVLLPLIFIVRALDPDPLVLENDELAFDSTKEARAFLKRFDPRAMPPDTITRVSATDDEINAAIGTALSGFEAVKGRVAVTPFGIVAVGTVALPLPETPLGRYVNLRATVLPSPTGVEIVRLAIGDNEVPASLIMPGLSLALQALLGKEKGLAALHSIKSVSTSGHRVTIAFQPPPDLVSDIVTAARETVRVADAAVVRVYYRRLAELSAALTPAGTVSLSAFLGPLFELASLRSALADPVEENRALILALAMAFGDERFERLVGPVSTGDLEDADIDARRVRLEGRHDWVQHFVVSAGIAVAGGRAIADVAGVAKEIADTDGPSGFSFTDIAADRAGVRFAEAATASVGAARRVQRALANSPRESDFFPRVGDLPEGLSEGQFKARYGDVNTQAYAAVIGEIDGRIARLALYREVRSF